MTAHDEAALATSAAPPVTERAKELSARDRFMPVRSSLHRLLRRAAAKLDVPNTAATIARVAPGGEVWQDFVRAGASLVSEKRLAEAEAIYGRALRAFPGDATLLKGFARTADRRGDYAFAAERWSTAVRAAPDDPAFRCAHATSLRLGGQLGLASAMLSEALLRFPEDTCLNLEAGRTATARGSFEQALRFWRKASEQTASSSESESEWVLGEITALTKLRRFDEAEAALARASKRKPALPGLRDVELALAAEQTRPVSKDAGDVAAVPAALDEIEISIADLMCEFESLGDNCEFGLAQRFCGAEPLGLFRFSSSRADNLVHAFSTEFAEYGTPEDLVIALDANGREYMARSRRYDDFTYHTEVFAPDGDVEKLRARELRKVAFLKRRLSADLRSGEKILVRKAGRYKFAMELAGLVRELGPNIFMWVQTADEDHPPGHVTVAGDGLLIGHVSRFAPYGTAPRLQVHDWLRVCLNALALAKAMRGQPQRYRLKQNPVLVCGHGWSFDEGRVAQRVVSDPIDGNVTNARLLTDMEHGHAAAWLHVPTVIDSDVTIVFSAWIKVAAAFQGSSIDMYIADLKFVHAHHADVHLRDQWQRIWSSAHPTSGERPVVVLNITGLAGDTVELGAWQLEEGFVPNDISVDGKAATAP